MFCTCNDIFQCFATMDLSQIQITIGAVSGVRLATSATPQISVIAFCVMMCIQEVPQKTKTQPHQVTAIVSTTSHLNFTLCMSLK